MNRRSALRLGLAALGLGAVGAGAAGLTGRAVGGHRGPARSLVVAAGEPGGFYVEFASLLAARLDADLGASVRPTDGSRSNLELVHDRRADLGLVLADSAATATGGGPPFPAPLPLRAIGRVYENYMQLVVAEEDPAGAVADLAGRRISLGAPGSGAALFGERLLAASGVTAAVDHRSLTEAAADLAAGRLDALLWSGGVPTPALVALAAARPIRLLDLTAALAPLRLAHGPVYQRVVVPPGTYGHRAAVATIGVANLLLTSPALPDDVAAAVARVLVRAAPDLIPPSAVGTQYLDLRSLITTAPVPLHPGAAAAYRDLHG
ncbi:TAXI family TRAP transporter solute-binding subunit [Actinokineospora spheciospongiae]|uniref:TAXI family TRAP transporter solute-binding subunit n=1 Tax=Actinokineospora spheciospongiae TaxID=909613 RepID=UPI000D7176A9|nr:TAXI family TRAP transporter solute-binding subunit [Actinokineospora spheciospongiae]PWW62761.1 hypothetical protein DFQ13_105579 [Actinokineospora spheciospongiae]